MHVCVQEASPTAAARIYKTTVPPLQRDCAGADGAFERRDLGKKPFVLQLNAVARSIAAEQGWATVNMEPLVAYFSDRWADHRPCIVLACTQMLPAWTHLVIHTI